MSASLREPAPPEQNPVAMPLDFAPRRPHAPLKQRVQKSFPAASLAVHISRNIEGRAVSGAFARLDNRFVSERWLHDRLLSQSRLLHRHAGGLPGWQLRA